MLDAFKVLLVQYDKKMFPYIGIRWMAFIRRLYQKLKNLNNFTFYDTHIRNRSLL